MYHFDIAWALPRRVTQLSALVPLSPGNRQPQLGFPCLEEPPRGSHLRVLLPLRLSGSPLHPNQAGSFPYSLTEETAVPGGGAWLFLPRGLFHHCLCPDHAPASQDVTSWSPASRPGAHPGTTAGTGTEHAKSHRLLISRIKAPGSSSPFLKARCTASYICCPKG